MQEAAPVAPPPALTPHCPPAPLVLSPPQQSQCSSVYLTCCPPCPGPQTQTQLLPFKLRLPMGHILARAPCAGTKFCPQVPPPGRMRPGPRLQCPHRSQPQSPLPATPTVHPPGQASPFPCGDEAHCPFRSAGTHTPPPNSPGTGRASRDPAVPTPKDSHPSPGCKGSKTQAPHTDLPGPAQHLCPPAAPAQPLRQRACPAAHQKRPLLSGRGNPRPAASPLNQLLTVRHPFLSARHCLLTGSLSS